ncbi:MAG: alcohol dehydrogenase catalytic domain-containing protein [Thermoplasmata archaeon]
MRALQLRPDQELPVPPDVAHPALGPGGMLLQVRAADVYRTELPLIHNSRQELARPVVLGHEIVGEVVSGGPIVVWRTRRPFRTQLLAFQLERRPIAAGNPEGKRYPLFFAATGESGAARAAGRGSGP